MSGPEVPDALWVAVRDHIDRSLPSNIRALAILNPAMRLRAERMLREVLTVGYQAGIDAAGAGTRGR